MFPLVTGLQGNKWLKKWWVKFWNILYIIEGEINFRKFAIPNMRRKRKYVNQRFDKVKYTTSRGISDGKQRRAWLVYGLVSS